MSETLSVSISGATFSFLLYENCKSKFDQEGFILGEIIKKETQTITDHDQTQVKVTKIIKVTSIVPCPSTCYFYDNAGRIDEAAIRSLLGDQAGDLVAWYKFKHANSFKFTFREKLIHRQLADLFRSNCGDLFSVCLLLAESSDNKSTHTYTQTFLRYNDFTTGYDQIPIHVVNLSDPNNCYKSREPSSDTFGKIVNGLKLDPSNMQGTTCIMRIMTAVQNHIDNLVDELSMAEKRLFDLENEVAVLREARVKRLMIGSSSMMDDLLGESGLVKNGAEIEIVSSPRDSQKDLFEDMEVEVEAAPTPSPEAKKTPKLEPEVKGTPKEVKAATRDVRVSREANREPSRDIKGALKEAKEPLKDVKELRNTKEPLRESPRSKTRNQRRRDVQE